MQEGGGGIFEIKEGLETINYTRVRRVQRPMHSGSGEP